MSDGPEVFRMAVRTVHFAASIGLFGAFTFFLLIARSPSVDVASAGNDRARRRLAIVGAAWLTVVVVSGVLWLGVEAVVMSGRAVGDALGGDTLGIVLVQTLFGQVWTLRAALAVAFAVALVFLARRVVQHDMMVFGLCALLAGAMLAALAWVGHANVERGIDRIVHRAVDAVHLLAAGAWLGGLMPLAATLSRAKDGSPSSLSDAARAAARFSTLGIFCVCTLAGTGFVNASYTVGSLAALDGTSYGRLLLVKLGFFALMIVPAALNRTRLVPLLASTTGGEVERSGAAQRLRRNAIIEVAAGLAVLVVVGILGVTPPAIRG